MKRNTFLTKAAATITAAAAAIAPLAYMAPAHAAVTSIGITNNADFVGMSADISTTTTVATDVNFTTTTVLDGASTDTIILYMNGVTAAALIEGDLTIDGPGGTACGAGLTPSGGAAPGAAAIGAVVSGTTNPSVTLNLGSGVSCNAGAFTLTIGSGELVTTATAGNYSFSVVTPDESGAALLYVGDTNDVQVEADVEPTLSFEIREDDDSGLKPYAVGSSVGPHLCDMGTLTTAAVGECAYRLKIQTNAANGFDVHVGVNQDFQNASASVLTAVADNTVTAGVEEYGIVVDPGSISGTTPGGAPGDGVIAVMGVWDSVNEVGLTIANAPTAGTSLFLSADAPNTSTGNNDLTYTSEVTHRAGISASTAAGLYTQVVTYTVTPSF